MSTDKNVISKGVNSTGICSTPTKKSEDTNHSRNIWVRKRYRAKLTGLEHESTQKVFETELFKGKACFLHKKENSIIINSPSGSN